jgi:hypothetical protein
LLFLSLISFRPKIDPPGLTFFISITTSSLMLYLTSKSKIKLIGIYFLFNIIFLGLLPWLHYTESRTIWRTYPTDPDVIIELNILITICNIFCYYIYTLAYSKIKTYSPKKIREKIKKISAIRLIIISTFGFVLLLYLNDFSWPALFFRSLAEQRENSVIKESSIGLMLDSIARMTPVFCFFYYYANRRKGLVTTTILSSLLVISVFPTGVPRYLVGFVYIPLSLIIFPTFRIASVFVTILIAALLFLFPFLEQFRSQSNLASINWIPEKEFFFQAHFDAYENFASAIENNFITYGRQLLGPLLFFVPRNIWPDKPIGSGFELAEKLNYEFSNISMPLLAEGYINFGLFGSISFACALGLTLGTIDRKFNSRIPMNGRIDYSGIMYFFCIGILFLILRGDLLSSTAYGTGAFVVWWTISLL